MADLKALPDVTLNNLDETIMNFEEVVKRICSGLLEIADVALSLILTLILILV